MTNLQVRDIIIQDRDSFIKTKKLKNAVHINAGLCKEFSFIVKEKIKDATILNVDQFYSYPDIMSFNPKKPSNIGTWNSERLKEFNNGDGSYPKVFDMLYLTPFHQWIYVDGKHYDAETEEGVENFFELPYFLDYIHAEHSETSRLIEKTNEQTLKDAFGLNIGLHSFESFSNIPPQKENNAKVGRNDSCPCGSGKKYKKCCA